LRKGVALLITVSLVATITALIGISAGILDNSFKRTSNKQFLIQSNLFFSDFITILKQNSSDINDSEMLDLFLMVPLAFENEEQDIHVDITFESEASSVNINNYISDSNKTNPVPNENFEEYLDRILTVYNVSDKILLLSMIADTIDRDKEERTTGSELVLEDPYFSQGSIFNQEHFDTILKAYKKNTLDFTVDSIPWDRLISFRGKDIDLNHISPDALGYLVPELDPSMRQELTENRVDVYDSFAMMGIDSETSKRLKKMGVSFFSPRVKAQMNIHQADHTSRLSFSYNLSTQEVSSLELY
jgi:hypothetical protein